MKNYTFTLLFLLLSTALLAQQDKRIAKNTRPLETVAQQVMPAQNNATLLENELSQRRPGRANHFAVPMSVHFSPDTHGTWETTADGTDIWRLRIYSQKAKSLNLGFTKYIMPQGGSMILYSPDLTEVKGPFTPSDNEEHEQLWTPVLLGDELVIEVQLPLNNRKGLELELSAVNHDFIGFQQVLSGSCNVDVLCGAADGFPEIDEYRDIIQSVAFMHLNGFANCTGFLVNNTGQDCKPYFMTAYHCGVGAADAPTLVTYWNFQNSYCREPNSTESGLDGDGLLETFNSGSTLISSYAPTDFVLVELDDPVVEGANAFFAGWNAEEVLPSRAIAVHHPSNDEKRISFENDPNFYTGTWDGGSDNIPDGDHVVVEDWDVGTTEGGSSGSPLFDQNKRVIGQLHGGGAACGNDNYDTYGWFFKSWEGGGTPQTRLRDWLDPNNTGQKIMDGNNCSIALSSSFSEVCNETASISTEVIIGGLFSNAVNLTLSDVPTGLDASLAQMQVNPNSNTTLTLSNIGALSAGIYLITINATDGQVSGAATYTLSVYENNVAAPNLITPANMATNVATFANFEWQGGANAQVSQIQIATDMGFSNIVAQADGLATTIFSNIILDPLTTYYWRVRSSNVCGASSWASTHSFTTANTFCGQLASTDGPIELGEGEPGFYTSTIDITQAGTIEDVNVLNIIGTHTWVSDLIVTLISPSGTSVILWQDECGSEDDFNISFDDASTATAITCPMTSGDVYQPDGLLSDFNGENAEGTWTLEIEDTANQDGGTFQSWDLQLCFTPTDLLTTSITDEVICNDQAFSFTITVGAFDNNVSLTPSISPTAPFKITYDADLNNVAPGTVINAMIADFTGIDLGAYMISYTATDGTTTASTDIALQLIDMPSSSILVSPLDMANNVAVNPTFEWTVATGSGYTIEVSTDVNFDNIIHSNSVTGTSYIYPDLLEEFTEYFWKVTTESPCGEAYSETFSFTTNDMVPVQEVLDNAVSVSPNPTAGWVQIQFEHALQQTTQLELYTINGQRLQQEYLSVQQQQASLNLSFYPKGVYILKIKTAQGSLSRRIVLQ